MYKFCCGIHSFKGGVSVIFSLAFTVPNVVKKWHFCCWLLYMFVGFLFGRLLKGWIKKSRETCQHTMFKSVLISNCDPQTSQNFSCKPADVLIPWHDCPIDTPVWPCINSVHQHEKHLYLHIYFPGFCESFILINNGFIDVCCIMQ